MAIDKDSNSFQEFKSELTQKLNAKLYEKLMAMKKSIASKMVGESSVIEEEDSALQKEYQAYFKKKLEDAGVKSPDELDEAGKKKFFDDVKAGWTKGEGEKA